MNILFVMEPRSNAGCSHALANYMRVGEEMGHTMALYGVPDPSMSGIRFTTDSRAFTRVIYVFESKLYRVNRLQEVAMLGTFPREHRYILDADARYKPMVVVDGYDRNYVSEDERTEWLRHYDALAGHIIQPSLTRSRDPRVRVLPFFGFNPDLVTPASECPPKAYDILYVGHNWWRWKEVATDLLPALEQIRDEVGEIGFIGLWWDGVPSWAAEKGLEPAYRVEHEAFRRLRIRTEKAVPYGDVIRTMGTGRVNIFLQRPYLRHANYLTLRYFEEFCADTTPLLMLDPDQAEAVYGPAGRELTLPGRVAEKVLDALRRPDHYRSLVEDVRRHLAAHHSYHQRVEELVATLAD